MAALIIKESQIDDVTLLKLKGVVVVGEGSVQFRAAVERALTEGRDQIVVDLKGVSYIDSSGMGELVQATMKVHKAGGRLQIYQLPYTIYERLAISKLLHVFDLVDNIEEALPKTLIAERYTFCPVYGCRNRLVFSGALVNWPETCMKCGTTLSLRISSVGSTNAEHIQATVISLSFPTYEQEFVEVILSAPCRFVVIGRLDFFVYEVIEKAWRTLLASRQVIVDVQSAGEVTRPGLNALLTLCANAGADDRAAILRTGEEASRTVGRLHSHFLYENIEQALAALGDKLEMAEQALTINIYEVASA